jgi:hypothetical protein
MKTRAFSHTMCAFLLSLAASGLAGCGGGSSNEQMPPPNQTPTITSISPNSAVAGGAGFTLTINGTNFIASSLVNFEGSAAPTTFVSSTQLTAAIPASSISRMGTAPVTVENPASDGGFSTPVNFTIAAGSGNPTPTINGLFPSCVPAGEQFVDSINNLLEVSGVNFVSSSVVQWNGTDLPTTLQSGGNGTLLFAQVPASDIATAGTAAVTVFNPPPGGGTSTSLTFTTTP